MPGAVLARCREMSKRQSLPSRLMEGLRVSHGSLTMSLCVVLTSLNASISSVTLTHESLHFQETLRHSSPGNVPSLDTLVPSKERGLLMQAIRLSQVSPLIPPSSFPA